MALAGAEHITIVNIPQDEKLATSLVELLRNKTEAKAEYVPWTDAFKVPEGCDILINATTHRALSQCK